MSTAHHTQCSRGKKDSTPLQPGHYTKTASGLRVYWQRHLGENQPNIIVMVRNTITTWCTPFISDTPHLHEDKLLTSTNQQK